MNFYVVREFDLFYFFRCFSNDSDKYNNKK